MALYWPPVVESPRDLQSRTVSSHSQTRDEGSIGCEVLAFSGRTFETEGD